MARVDPNASFEAAAVHLFRHLAEPRELRRNPLVRRFFERSQAGGVTPLSESVALGAIRDLVVQEAAVYFERATLYPDQTHRQRMILNLHGLEGRPLAEVAAALGISGRQCYRERAEIIKQVAKGVASREVRFERAASVLPTEFQLQMNRAAFHADLGEFDQANREYDDIARSDPSPARKITALCKQADTSLEHSRFPQSERSLAAARELFREGPATLGDAGSIAAAQIQLIRSKLCWVTGRFEEEALALRQALVRLEPIVADDNAGELYVAALLESCDRFRTRGDYGRARDQLLKAENVLASFSTPMTGLRFDAMFESWTLGGMGAEFESSSTTRLGRYGALLEMSRLTHSFPSPKRITRVARGLMQYHAESGDHAGASEWADRALRIAKRHAGPRVVAQVGLDVADWLITTQSWSRVPRLLQTADRLLTRGHPDWIALQALWAYYSLRTRRYADAKVRAIASESAAADMKNGRYQAATWTTTALAAHALGERNEARERVDAAVEVLEGCGTPWTCVNAYQAAATITGEAQYRRKAGQIRDQLKTQFSPA